MRKTTKRTLLTALMIVLIMTVTVSGTLAYLIAQSGEVENVFEPTEVTCKVTESFDGNVKSNVQIQNTGDVSAYIRAAIVVTWQNGAGEVYGELPVLGTDYSLSLNTTDWKENGGFYYYTSPVASGASTPVLINECKVLDVAPADGYTLHVEIIAGAIQSEGGAVTIGSDGGWTITPVQ